MSNQQNITDSVRALAAVRGDTNADLAVALGLSESSAAGKRTGRINWTLSDVEALASHFGVKAEQLLAGPWAWLGLTSSGGDTARYRSDDLPAMAA